ncbi:hypothetical protein EV385_4097 [Krasilnikovia cinnamomea]|uniref:DUF2029 domain-containing protein n=1 Tax=Krasilnikovia cinnamomea TaxID=349313 RepID=A0A4Q7ZPJ2_9ACTN|nr:hypothetical protein [Krasilnikovia cinnamomea]RZU52249.1 hypothetical protein EV385_4097 [Krasilnikovia cinnamomea]
MSGVGAFLLRHRRWLAGLLAALVGLLNQRLPWDLEDFSDLGLAVLTGRFDEAYAGPWTQAGPLQLVLSPLLFLGAHDGIPPALPRIIVAVALTLGAIAAGRGQPVREVAAAILALLWLTGPVPWDGHPVEVAMPILWAYAMVLSGKGRWLAAAFALGVSVWIAPVAVLGFGCLLGVTGLRGAVRTAVTAAGIAVLGYLPFVLSGEFGMFGHVWPVGAGTLPELLGMHEVTWTARLGQAVVVGGGCALVAYLLRGRLVVVAAAPLAAALLRVITDPMSFDYYWLPVSVGTVLLVALMPDDLPTWRQVLLAVVGYAAVVGAAIGPAPLVALVCLVGYLVAGVPFGGATRSSDPRTVVGNSLGPPDYGDPLIRAGLSPRKVLR